MSFFYSSRRCSMILHYSLVWSLPENKVVVMVHILTSEIISVNQYPRNEGKTSEYWNNSLESSLFCDCKTNLVQILKYAFYFPYNSTGTCKNKGEITKSMEQLCCQTSLIWFVHIRLLFSSQLAVSLYVFSTWFTFQIPLQ